MRLDARDVVYRRAVRPLLLAAGGSDAEVAHQRTLAALRYVARRPSLLAGLRRLMAPRGAPRTVFGLRFPSPVGLAAGVDKDGVAVAAWPALGFGFVEAGTVTAVPQAGNPTPRIFRLPQSGAVINRMGFPNDGAVALADRLAATGPIGVPVGISLGKSKVTPLSQAVGDYLTSLRVVHEHADYVAVNVSSPNTPGLRGLQDRDALEELLAALVAETQALARPALRDGTPVPVLVKISPDLTDDGIGDVLEVCADRGVAGVIAVNTTTTRPGMVAGERGWAMEAGGLSGAPLRRRALEVVRFVTGHTDLPVIGVGGIGSVDDGLAMLDAGASLLQLYTGFIYYGPELVRSLTRAIGNEGSER